MLELSWFVLNTPVVGDLLLIILIFFAQRVMDQKYLSVALHLGIEFVRILLKLIAYRRIHTQTSVSVLCLTPPISVFFVILSKRFLFFASLQKEAGKHLLKTSSSCLYLT